jgi:hypothetical protein
MDATNPYEGQLLEVKNDIIEWGKLAFTANDKLNLICEKLNTFIFHPQAFEHCRSTLRAYLVEALPLHEQDIIIQSNEIYGIGTSNLSSPEDVALRTKRLQINRKINHLIKQIKDFMFPNIREELDVEKGEEILMKNRRRSSRSSSVVGSTTEETPTVVDNPIISTSFHIDGEEEDEEYEGEETSRMPRYQTRNDFIHKNPDTPDLFITQEEDVKLIFDYLQHYRGKTIYDPCAGYGVYGKVIREEGFSSNVIEYDLHYGDFEKKDYLTSEDPPYDLLLTNPPYVKKYDFLKKMYESKKPFCVLLPSETLFHKNTSELFMKYGVNVLVIMPHPKFLHDGKISKPMSTAYFIGNDTFNQVGVIQFKYHVKEQSIEKEVLSKDEEDF